VERPLLTLTRASGGLPCALVFTAVILLLSAPLQSPSPEILSSHLTLERPLASNASPVDNFTASVDRLVELLGLAGSGLLALVWARVALSWFSHDVTKKIQAKDRARDALVGTLLFVAALTGLIWGLAHWVLTGS